MLYSIMTQTPPDWWYDAIASCALPKTVRNMAEEDRREGLAVSWAAICKVRGDAAGRRWRSRKEGGSKRTLRESDVDSSANAGRIVFRGGL